MLTPSFGSGRNDTISDPVRWSGGVRREKRGHSILTIEIGRPDGTPYLLCCMNSRCVHK